MNAMINRQVIVDNLPEGLPEASNFRMEDGEIPTCGEGQFLARCLYISVDPYMVGRLKVSAAAYTAGVQPGDVMQCYTVSEIIESKHADYKVGDKVYGSYNMQDYAVGDGSEVIVRVDTDLLPLEAWQGLMGMAGQTAYWGLETIGQPKEGETVLVSAAVGSVGSLVGQIAKARGARVVGVTSSADKCQQALETFGYDAAIAYRDTDGRAFTPAELTAKIKEACPDGIDVYFDNTGGDISEAAWPLYNLRARIIICGRIAVSHLKPGEADIGLRDQGFMIASRIRKEGFLVFDHWHRAAEAVGPLAALVKEGKLNYQTDVMEGIENAPLAFERMLRGHNVGKQIVKVS
jgi:NADPH-dependent curcumin reductase CurA